MAEPKPPRLSDDLEGKEDTCIVLCGRRGITVKGTTVNVWDLVRFTFSHKHKTRIDIIQRDLLLESTLLPLNEDSDLQFWNFENFETKPNQITH